MSQRSVLGIVYWTAFNSDVVSTISPNADIDTVRPDFSITYRDDWVMLLIDVGVLTALAWLG